MKAIIGGTGFYNLDYLSDVQSLTVRTPFGGAKIFRGQMQGEPVCFLPRHGPEHNQLAPEVNYRANIWALHELGVDRILGTSAVGSLNPEMQVGDLVALEQLVDFTRHRADSFFLGSVNFTEPYCPQIRQTIQDQGQAEGIPVHPMATYISLEGPRYETRAEINLYRNLGMDVVGMTNGTEAILARELGICYGVIAIVTNMAAGLGTTEPNLETHKRVMQENSAKLRQLALATLAALPEAHSCPCSSYAAKPIRSV